MLSSKLNCVRAIMRTMTKCFSIHSLKCSTSIHPFGLNPYIVRVTSPFAHSELNVLASKITMGGIPWPTELTHPTTATWPTAIPDVFCPFLATTLGTLWSMGMPVSSMLYNWAGLSSKSFCVITLPSTLKYCFKQSALVQESRTTAVESPYLRDKLDWLSLNQCHHPSLIFFITIHEALFLRNCFYYHFPFQHVFPSPVPATSWR